VGLEQLMPEVELIGVTVSRVADQKPKVVTLQQAVAEQLELKAKADIVLWDDYFAPGYGTPNEEGMEAVKLLARLKVSCLIRSIPAKRWPGLSTALRRNALRMKGRFYLSTPAGRLRCLPIILMSKNQVEK
jgi:D-cysteine desulfhydrase